MRKGPLGIVCDQFATIPTVANADLTGKTVIVVGANTGLGFEASKHFATMNPERLILACRSSERGGAAVQRLKAETGYSAELKLVDLADFQSIKSFVNELIAENARLDIVVQNAAIVTENYVLSAHGFENTLQVNNLGTSYLALLLLPLMHTSAEKYAITPRLCIVTSDVHYLAAIPKEAVGAPQILKKMSEKEFCTKSAMRARYIESKLMIVMFVRALAQYSSSKVIVNGPNPGFCVSELRRDLKGVISLINVAVEKMVAFTTEQGSRQLVWAAIGGSKEISPSEPEGVYTSDQLHGQYIAASKVQEVADYVLSDEGIAIQNRIWNETLEILGGVDSSLKSGLEAIKAV